MELERVCGCGLTAGNGLHEHAGTDIHCTKTILFMHPDSNLEILMARYQEGDFAAATVLIDRISPQLHRFFVAQFGSRADADDLLQETWLRIHRVRHTYRPGEPVLPWIYAIARRVRVDGYRRTRRITLHEITMELLPERPSPVRDRNLGPAFDTLVAALPEAQREVVTMLKVGGL